MTNLRTSTTPDLVRYEANLTEHLASLPGGHLARYSMMRELDDVRAEVAKRVEKALDEFSAMIEGWDNITLVKLRVLAVEGRDEGRPGNFAGMIERIDRELAKTDGF